MPPDWPLHVYVILVAWVAFLAFMWWALGPDRER